MGAKSKHIRQAGIAARLRGLGLTVTRQVGRLVGGDTPASGSPSTRVPASNGGPPAARAAAGGNGPVAATTAAPGLPEVLDRGTLEQLRRLGQARGRDLLDKVARLFLESAPSQLGGIRDGVRRADLAAVSAAAHGLKSASANLGAMALSQHCATIEQAARDGRLEHLAGLTAGLDATADAAFKAVEGLLAPFAGPVPGGSKVSPATGGKRILIVDDDAAFRLATREALQSAGFVCEETADGNQALSSLGRFQPDLVLLDAVMRGIDGFATCERMRRHPKCTTTPILMVTGLHDVESVERAFHAGATDFATKPVSYPVLIQRIHFMLRASATESSLREHKAMLLAAQRVARLGYWRWDQASGGFELSETLCEMLDINAGEFPAVVEAFLALVHDDDRDRVGEHLHVALHDRQLTSFDYRVRGRRDEPSTVHQELDLLATAGGFTLLGTVQDVTEQRKAEERIRRMAYYDALTGLASRSHLTQRLEDTIKVARRRPQRFTVLLLDLDGFKDVNDSLGHDIGDEMLVRVARRLPGVVRDIDFVARLGGDEFCILLDDTGDESDAAEVAARCLDAISQPIALGALGWRPQGSIGLARFPEDGDTSSLLLKAADSAMYAAKQAGKHRFAFYRPEMTEESERRLANEQMLREAIEHEQFELQYQPVIDLQTGRMVGVEALARWLHPQRGAVMPREFIPTLERIGLIRTFGAWTLRTACRQAVDWLNAGMPEFRMAINFSALQFNDPDMPESVRYALADAGLSPHLLEIEITESSVQPDTGPMQVLQQLQDMGVRISIDDFGTGCSSLGSLKHLPIHTLKIDRLFVADVLNSAEDAVMLGTIIGLAHALGYTVLAEGVEERDQARVVAGLGCDLSQGCFFSPPVGAEAIPALMKREPFFWIKSNEPAAHAETLHGGRHV